MMHSKYLRREITHSFYRSRLFFLSLVASILCLPFIFPPDYLRGIGKYWANPGQEINIAFAGFHYYIADKQWFPLGWIRNINTPEGTNVLFVCCIPLISFVAKVLYQLFSIEINGIYLWSLLCAILQGVSFAYLMVALNVRKTAIIMLAAIMAILMPPNLWRLEYAVALPHFLICFALAYYFLISGKDHSIQTIRYAVVSFALMVVISYLLNPYFTAMILPIFGVSLLYAVLKKKITFFYAIKTSILVACSMAFIAYAFGYFYGKALSTESYGFNFFSMNVVGPFDVGYSSLYKMISPHAVPANANGGQQEGMQYLGLGCIFLLILAVCFQGKKIFSAIRHHYLLTLLIVGITIFSLSNMIYFEKKLVFEYTVPHFLIVLTQIFRAPGRFFWPVGYLLVATSIAIITRKTPKFAVFILSIAVLIQIADTQDLRKELRDILSGVNAAGMPAGKYTEPYDVGGIPSPVMRNLAKYHHNFKQYPSWWCGGIGHQLFEMEINYIASEYLVSQNSFYTARANKNCYAEKLEAQTVSHFAPNTLYIFAQQFADLERLHTQGVDLSACRIVKGFYVQPGYEKIPLIVCSEQFKTQLSKFIVNSPAGWPYPNGGLYPINFSKFKNAPVITHITVSSTFDKKLFPPENLIGNQTKEVPYEVVPNYWISSPGETNNWVRLELDGNYKISQIKLLNTMNAGSRDRGTEKASIELMDDKGIVKSINVAKVESYPQWTTINIHQSKLVHAIKILVTQAEVNGAGLNKVKIIGTKVS